MLALSWGLFWDARLNRLVFVMWDCERISCIHVAALSYRKFESNGCSASQLLDGHILWVAHVHAV